MSDRIGRKQILVAGWLLPLMIKLAPSWEWVVAARGRLERSADDRACVGQRNPLRQRTQSRIPSELGPASAWGRMSFGTVGTRGLQAIAQVGICSR
jgi:hypothetical protein